MKTFTKIQTLIVIVIFSFLIISCAKERIEEQTDYTSLDEFYKNNQPEEQSFIIDSTGHDSIVGKEGTIIWNLPKTNYMYKSNHQDIFYPYVLKLIEAYTLKNMILSQLPTVAQGRILKSGGEIKLTAYKDNQELLLKEGRSVNTWNPNANPDNSMNVFYGFTKGSTYDWNNDITKTDFIFLTDSATSISTYNSGYLMSIAKLGWVNIDRFYDYTNRASITFTAEGTNTNMIDLYVIFNNIHSFTKITSMVASDLPLNESITVLALGKDSKGKMRYFKQDYTISENLTIPLDMKIATESDVLTLMNNL